MEINAHLQAVSDYLIFYADPRFRRRAIVARANRISLFLVNRLLDLHQLTFSEKLTELSTNYRTETRADYEIAGENVTSLWHKFLGRILSQS